MAFEGFPGSRELELTLPAVQTTHFFGGVVVPPDLLWQLNLSLGERFPLGEIVLRF
jgi:predicted lysophospholipase L1 biosynthesis ABC-type transport system permease subunit